MHPKGQLLNVDPGFGILKAFIVEKTGMTYYLDKEQDLAVKLQQHIGDRFANCSLYLQYLQSSEGVHEIEQLISELTIGETFFFRHEPQWDVLRDHALPALIESNQSERQLKIWSAGCSIGAEPYSISILLEQVLGFARESWSVNLVATDINQRFLSTATQGLFGDWALRSSPDQFRFQHFDREDQQWRIKSRYREPVKFGYHNLVNNSHPPVELTSGGVGCDLIVCRNVMIYFDKQAIRSIAKTFYDSLRPGGWLLVGPSEGDIEIFSDFETIAFPGATIYRKSLQNGRKPRLVTGKKAIAFDDPEEKIKELMSLARWGEMLAACETAIASDPLHAGFHYYRGIALRNIKRLNDAEEAFRKTIYLERTAYPAHFELGLILRDRQEHCAARKSFRNALRSLPNGQDIRFGSRLTEEMIQTETEGLVS